MLTFDDIPAEYHGHRVEPGPRYHRFAAGLLARLTDSYGDSGADAGHRLVQSAWHLRYAGVGLEMHRIAPSISSALNEDDQFVYLSGFQLTVTSAVAAIDLGAAALAYLAGGAQREPDLRQLASTPMNGLSPAQRDWVVTTNAMADVTDTEITKLDAYIAQVFKGHPGYEAIQAIHGVGPVLGAIFVAELGDVTRFKTAKHVCSWAGLTAPNQTDSHRRTAAATHTRRQTPQPAQTPS